MRPPTDDRHALELPDSTLAGILSLPAVRNTAACSFNRDAIFRNAMLSAGLPLRVWLLASDFRPNQSNSIFQKGMTMLNRIAIWTVLLTCVLPSFAARSFGAGSAAAPYSFEKAPFIPPRIVGELNTWLSDGGDQVVAVNLTDAVDSNRYFGAISTQDGAEGNPYVFTDGECGDAGKAGCANFGPPSFGYRLVGRSASGVYVLFTEESGGGSGRFRNLMFVTLEHDKGLDYDEKGAVLRLTRDRWLIRKLGEIALGDRYDGKVRVDGNRVIIEADRHDAAPGATGHDKVIRLEIPGR